MNLLFARGMLQVTDDRYILLHLLSIKLISRIVEMFEITTRHEVFLYVYYVL